MQTNTPNESEKKQNESERQHEWR